MMEGWLTYRLRDNDKSSSQKDRVLNCVQWGSICVSEPVLESFRGVERTNMFGSDKIHSCGMACSDNSANKRIRFSSLGDGDGSAIGVDIDGMGECARDLSPQHSSATELIADASQKGRKSSKPIERGSDVEIAGCP